MALDELKMYLLTEIELCNARLLILSDLLSREVEKARLKTLEQIAHMLE
jgi:hypothetical protein